MSYFSAAVKFNQPLIIEEMEQMMKALTECNLPFQCAHGRPSIAPIIDLEDFQNPVCKNVKKKKNLPGTFFPAIFRNKYLDFYF